MRNKSKKIKEQNRLREWKRQNREEVKEQSFKQKILKKLLLMQRNILNGKG